MLLAVSFLPQPPNKESQQGQRDRYCPVDPESMRNGRVPISDSVGRVKVEKRHAEEGLKRQVWLAITFLDSSFRTWLLTATNVDGKKVMVTTAIAFIDAVFLRASSAIRTCTLLSRCASELKAWMVGLVSSWIRSELFDGIAYQGYLILESCFIRFGSREETLEKLSLKVEIALWITVGLRVLEVLACKLFLLFLQALKRVQYYG